MPNVKFVKDELRRKLNQYQLISDCLEGQEQVKFRRVKYLPQPNAADTSANNVLRYQAYLDRAVFYNVTSRTQAGLVGAVFESPPSEKLPDVLKPVIDDASGGGISLVQTAKWAVGEVLAKGRGGLWVDFPEAPPGGITREQLASGEFRPIIKFFIAERIINWRVVKDGAHDRLTLVVIEETYTKADDGFEEKLGKQYRVLRLVNGVYSVQVYREESAVALAKPIESYTPTDHNGKPLTEIPFVFIGSENNDPDVDRAPLYDMASLNIAHYRNSADFEEASYIVGQPTPWFSGLTETWVKNVLGGRIELGSRAAIALPENGAAGLLQAEETTLAFQAMEHKERQMVALGARLVQNEGTQRTLGEAKMEDASETSVLSTVADNVSDAIEWVLSKAMLFIDGTEPEPSESFQYRLNTRYGLSNLPPEELNAIMGAWTAGGIDWEELRSRLRAGGIATKKDAEAKAAIEKDQAATDARETEKLNAQAEGGAKAAAKFPKPKA